MITTSPARKTDTASAIPRRKIVAWAFWDWGTQPFATVITTFVFAVYITGSDFGSKNDTNLAMACSTGIAGFLIAALAPVLGQNSDRRGGRMRSLRVATWALALLSAALFFVKPEPAYLVLGLVLMGLGAVISEIGNVNYYALLEDITTKENVGRISGLGWGLGYLGGIVSLLMLYFFLIAPEVGIFGVTDAGALDVRVSMLVCGIWILAFTVPLFIALRDKPREGVPERIGIRQSYRRLFSSVANIWHNDRQTAYFLLASALFRDGLAGVFTFGAVIAAGTFGMSTSEVIIFGAVANVIAGLATIGFGYLDDRIGPKRVILISLFSMMVAGLAVFWIGRGVTIGQISTESGTAAFWFLGLALTVFVGPAQSASRSYLTRLTPVGKSGEMFGLYATTGRAVSFLSPVAYGAAITIGAAATGRDTTQYWGILGIVLVLSLGTACMVLVKDPGQRAADNPAQTTAQ